jgi:hypothetical protein
LRTAYRALGNETEAIEYLASFGNFSLVKPVTNEIIEDHKRKLILAQNNNNLSEERQILISLVVLHWKFGDDAKALKYAEQDLSVARDEKDTEWLTNQLRLQLLSHWRERWGELPKAIEEGVQVDSLSQLVGWGQGSEGVDSIEGLRALVMGVVVGEDSVNSAD